MPAPAYRWAAAAYVFGLVSGPALWRSVDGFHRRTGAAVFASLHPVDDHEVLELAALRRVRMWTSTTRS
jgi:hypothetical protein